MQELGAKWQVPSQNLTGKDLYVSFCNIKSSPMAKLREPTLG